jgi:hypothetical protein
MGKMTRRGEIICRAFFPIRYDPLQLNDGEVKNVNYAYLSVRKKNIILF